MNRVFQKIVLVSFFLQALIPVGFMPVFANDGTTIVICSGVTGESFEIQLDHDDNGSSKCAYSIVGSYATISTPSLAKLDVSYIMINTKIEDSFIVQSAISFNHTRGPPIISLI